VVRGEEAFRLVPPRGDAGWRVEWEGGSAPADALQVRRYLQYLASLAAAPGDAGSLPLTEADEVGRVVALLPGIDRERERLVLRAGKAADGLIPVTVTTSTQGTAGFPPRVRVKAGGAFLLLPARSHFLRPEDVGR
jgi:hypothetical protein